MIGTEVGTANGRILPNCGVSTGVGADFLKTIFFARPIFLFKSFAQTKWSKNQQKSLKYDPKKVKQW